MVYFFCGDGPRSDAATHRGVRKLLDAAAISGMIADINPPNGIRCPMPSVTKQNHDETGSMNGTLLAVALLMLALLLAPNAQGQPGPVPTQAQQTVPDWVVPGARITQYGASSQHTKRNRTRDNSWREEDERARQRDIDEGLPMDEVERRARQREEGRASDRRLYNTGTGGYGFTQYDIVAVTEAGVLMELRTYGVPLAGDQSPQLGVGTAVLLVDHATGDGLWLLPDAIEAMEESDGSDGGLVVYKAPYSIGEHRFDAVALVNASGDTTIRRVYDRATGMQLYQSQVTDTADLRSHVYSEMSGYRVAELPWIGGRFSQQVQGFTKLVFQGAMVYTVEQLQSGSERLPETRIEMGVEFAISAATDELIDAEMAVEIDAPNGQRESNQKRELLSPNSRLGLYIEPGVLARLEDGQVLDQDPAIGYTIRVTDVYQVDGVTLVEITEAGRNNSYTVVSTYDARFGLQVAYVSRHPALNRRIEMNLTGVE